jgi:glycosyltransferase involved in cell wall biosynthesis
LESLVERQNGQLDVILTGHLHVNQIVQVLHDANIFILATKNDPNPLSVIEAAFAGLPLIISRLAGNAEELVKPGVNGFLLDEISSERIRETLSKTIMISEGDLLDMGKRSKDIATKGFVSSHIARSFIIQIFRDK